MIQLDRFYPIFDSINWLVKLLPLGIKFVQLRIKNQPTEQVREQITAARNLCHQFNCQLVVNDYWQLAIELACDFVHLGQEDLDSADVKQLKQAGIKLGISTHDEQELERALRFDPDYVALGPIYPTILKKMKIKQQGLDRLTQWRTLVGDLPLVAIGGMSVERAQGAFDAGADCVSVVTDITLNPEPAARVQEWLKVTRRKI